MSELSNGDRRIINLLSQDFPVKPHPFFEIAKETGISVEVLFKKINEYKKKGLIRRFGAVLNHTRFKSAFTNTMVVWKVSKEKIENMGKIASKFSQVSHCYQRKMHPKWKYNFYTMIHANSAKECQRLVEQIAKEGGINNYKILVTTCEYKKSIPSYFSDAKNSKQYSANQGESKKCLSLKKP